MRADPVRKGGNDYTYGIKVFQAPLRLLDGTADDDPVHPERDDPAPLVLPLRAFARRVGRDVRANREERADHPRVPRRRLSVELRPASSLSLAELADLFNAAYEDYVIPFRLDESSAPRHGRHVRPRPRRVAHRLGDGEPVGFGNLGLRGDEAWIGGVGVVPPARRQGSARR